jgi:hypothetical protein
VPLSFWKLERNHRKSRERWKSGRLEVEDLWRLTVVEAIVSKIFLKINCARGRDGYFNRRFGRVGGWKRWNENGKSGDEGLKIAVDKG